MSQFAFLTQWSREDKKNHIKISLKGRNMDNGHDKTSRGLDKSRSSHFDNPV